MYVVQPASNQWTDRLTYRRENAMPEPTDEDPSFPAADGDMSVVTTLRETHGCPWNWRTCSAAAQAGQLEVLKWAKSRGCGFPWDVICAFAAVGGSIPVLRWARAQGCPWDAETCASAAEGGHLEMLKYLTSQGCPWDADTIAMATVNNHQHILRWAVEKGCPTS